MASRSMTQAAALPTSSAARTSRSTTPRSISASTIWSRGVAANPVAVAVSDRGGSLAASVVHFRMYSNYASFIKRAEIRIFEQQQSLQAVPLEIIAVDNAGLAEWHPTAGILAGQARELKYLLRAYDSKGNFDETDARPLRLYREPSPGDVVTSDGPS